MAAGTRCDTASRAGLAQGRGSRAPRQRVTARASGSRGQPDGAVIQAAVRRLVGRLLGRRPPPGLVSRPSVAVVSTYYRPVVGGAEVAAERLATFLARRGHRVIVLTKRTSRAHKAIEEAAGVTIVRLPPVAERSGRGKWTFLPTLFAALVRHRHDTDVVCCIDYRGIGTAALAARALTGRRVIFQAQTEG